jgi:hypothetical protein
MRSLLGTLPEKSVGIDFISIMRRSRAKANVMPGII